MGKYIVKMKHSKESCLFLCVMQTASELCCAASVMSGENKPPILTPPLHPQHPCSNLLCYSAPHASLSQCYRAASNLMYSCYVPLKFRFYRNQCKDAPCAPWPVAGPRVTAACRAACAAARGSDPQQPASVSPNFPTLPFSTVSHVATEYSAVLHT